MNSDDLNKRKLFENDDLLVIDKPYDMPSTGRSLDDSDCLQYWVIKAQDQMIWALHQLDADTTGINIFVKKKKLVAKYKDLLSSSESSKKYLAIVHGQPTWDEIHEHANLGYIDERSFGIVENGKSAHSFFKTLQTSERASLIMAEIFTGRTHQIRLHLSHLGHPLFGEEWYSRPPCKEHPRQTLHAWKVSLGKDDHFLSEPPQDFLTLSKKLNLDLEKVL